MAKERDPEKPDITSLMCHRETSRQLRTIADHRDITMAQALDQYGGPAILREYKKVLAEKNAEISPVEVGGEA